MRAIQGRTPFPVVLLAGAFALALSACEPAAQEGMDEDVAGAAETAAGEVGAATEQALRDAEAEIMELSREWSNRVGQGDVDWTVDLHAENGRVMPPNAEPAVGPEAVRAFWGGLLGTEGLSVSWEPSEVHVASSGDMAYELGTYEMTLPDGSEDDGKYTVVWVKEGGEWRIAVDMFSSNRPPPGEGG